MPIYKLSQNQIEPLTKTTFAKLGLHERHDLQRLLRKNIKVIAPDTMVIAEECSQWDASHCRIDLLCVDRCANLVVVELKRTEDGGHMELQAIRYAAMVSTMTFDQAVVAFENYLQQTGSGDTDARGTLLDFLSWDEPNEDQFAQEVKIVLASADFSLELTTAVLWLNQRDLDIRCVRLQPYDLSGQVVVDVQQIIPPPEAAEYQVGVRDKVRKEREARTGLADFTKYDLKLGQTEYKGKPKRQVILLMFQYLVGSGIPPEDVLKSCGPDLGGRFLYWVDGDVESDEFVRRATAACSEIGKVFNKIKWFCSNEQLIRFGGRTYAVSNQWGGAHWLNTITSIRDAFPDRGIVFTAVPR